MAQRSKRPGIYAGRGQRRGCEEGGGAWLAVEARLIPARINNPLAFGLAIPRGPAPLGTPDGLEAARRAKQYARILCQLDLVPRECRSG
jgi:hypothetical protein